MVIMQDWPGLVKVGKDRRRRTLMTGHDYVGLSRTGISNNVTIDE